MNLRLFYTLLTSVGIPLLIIKSTISTGTFSVKNRFINGYDFREQAISFFRIIINEYRCSEKQKNI